MLKRLLISGSTLRVRSNKEKQEIANQLRENIWPLIENKTIELFIDKKYEYIFSVENLNELVKSGKSFRDSYNQVSNEIKNESFVPKKDIKHEIIGGINNLCLDEIELKMNKIFDL